MKRIKEGSRVWKKRYLELADTHMHVRTCRNCGSPAKVGIICGYCDVDDTSHAFQQKLREARKLSST